MADCQKWTKKILPLLLTEDAAHGMFAIKAGNHIYSSRSYTTWNIREIPTLLKSVNQQIKEKSIYIMCPWKMRKRIKNVINKDGLILWIWSLGIYAMKWRSTLDYKL